MTPAKSSPSKPSKPPASSTVVSSSLSSQRSSSCAAIKCPCSPPWMSSRPASSLAKPSAVSVASPPAVAGAGNAIYPGASASAQISPRPYRSIKRCIRYNSTNPRSTSSSSSFSTECAPKNTAPAKSSAGISSLFNRPLLRRILPRPRTILSRPLLTHPMDFARITRVRRRNPAPRFPEDRCSQARTGRLKMDLESSARFLCPLSHVVETHSQSKQMGNENSFPPWRSITQR